MFFTYVSPADSDAEPIKVAATVTLDYDAKDVDFNDKDSKAYRDLEKSVKDEVSQCSLENVLDPSKA